MITTIILSDNYYGNDIILQKMVNRQDVLAKLIMIGMWFYVGVLYALCIAFCNQMLYILSAHALMQKLQNVIAMYNHKYI